MMDEHLIFICGHYPFGTSESFIEDELEVATSYFKKITVLSLEKDRKNVRRIPKEVEIVICRKKRFEIRYLLTATIKFFSISTIKELFFSKKILYKNEKIFTISKRIFISYYIASLLDKKLQKFSTKCSAIFYSYWLSDAAYSLSILKKYNQKVYCISRAHGGDCFIDRGYNSFRREIFNNLDEIHVISFAGIESLKNVVPYSNNKQNNLYYSPLGIKKLSEKMNPEKKDDHFHIVTVSNIIKLKRLDLLILALSLIEGIHISWVHFGEGAERDVIMKLSKDLLDKKRNIQYRFMGQRQKNEILDYYEKNHIDVFINYSDAEGIPVSIMEAMSYGIPVIARNIGGNAEIVSSDNGILLQRESDHYMLAEAIQIIAKLPQEEYKILSNEAYQTYFTKYNAQKNYSKFFEKMISTKEKFYEDSNF